MIADFCKHADYQANSPHSNWTEPTREMIWNDAEISSRCHTLTPFANVVRFVSCANWPRVVEFAHSPRASFLPGNLQTGASTALTQFALWRQRFIFLVGRTTKQCARPHETRLGLGDEGYLFVISINQLMLLPVEAGHDSANMVKIYDYTEPILSPLYGPVPKPQTKIDDYDPTVEPPKWNWSRLRWGYDKPEVHPDKPLTGGVAESDDKPDWRGVIKNNVIPLDPEKAYDFGQPEFKGYYFFDTPDYADPFKKLWFSAKFFFKTAGLIACSAGIITNADANWATFRRLFRNVALPWFAGGMIASATVITVANLRGKKDDQWNYFAAGLVAACYTGRSGWVKHMNHSIYWPAMAIAAKYINENNMVLLPMFDQGSRHLGIQANSCENGILSGNLHFIKGSHGDPGRDTRRHAP